MIREEENLQLVVHEQIAKILTVLRRDLYSTGIDSGSKIDSFVQEWDRVLTETIHSGKPVPIESSLIISSERFLVVKSFLLIRQSKILVSNYKSKEWLLMFKDEFIKDLAKVLKN